ncbi:hypothetical protein [Brevundimonas sp.]|nr:hypothetical protein [Brevundimonas sp.]
MAITFWGWVLIGTGGVLALLSLILVIALRVILRRPSDTTIPQPELDV